MNTFNMKNHCTEKKMQKRENFSVLWIFVKNNFFREKAASHTKSSQCCKAVILPITHYANLCGPIMPITVERNEDWHQDIWMKPIHCLKLSGYRKVMSVRYSLEAVLQSLQELTQDCQLVLHWCFWAEISNWRRETKIWSRVNWI